MKKLEDDLKEFAELSNVEYKNIEGGSELSEAIFHGIGSFFRYAGAFIEGAREGSKIFYK